MADILFVDNSICNDCPLRETCLTATYELVVLSCGKRAEHEAE